MKKLYRTFFLFTVLLLISVFLTLPTFAATEAAEPQILMFEDGSYIVITIECDQLQDQDGVSGLADRSIKSGTKKYAYYDGSDTLAWECCVHGTFTYDGLTATATGARHSYNIYDNKWSFLDGNATYSGATATATGRFRRALFPYTATVSLTCSPNGVLS